LLEYGDRILSTLDQSLSDYALRDLRKRGIDVRVKTTLTSLGTDRCQLTDGSTLLTNTVIWCAGIAPSPAVHNLPFDKDKRGYLIAERDLRLRGRNNVWAIGDCAVNPDKDGT